MYGGHRCWGEWWCGAVVEGVLTSLMAVRVDLSHNQRTTLTGGGARAPPTTLQTRPAALGRGGRRAGDAPPPSGRSGWPPRLLAPGRACPPSTGRRPRAPSHVPPQPAPLNGRPTMGGGGDAQRPAFPPTSTASAVLTSHQCGGGAVRLSDTWPREARKKNTGERKKKEKGVARRQAVLQDGVAAGWVAGGGVGIPGGWPRALLYWLPVSACDAGGPLLNGPANQRP